MLSKALVRLGLATLLATVVHLGVAHAAAPTQEEMLADLKAWKQAKPNDAGYQAALKQLEMVVKQAPAAAAAKWPGVRKKLGQRVAARKALSDKFPIPKPGAITFSTSKGGATATSFVLGKDAIMGTVNLTAPLKAAHRAYTDPPGADDYKQGIATVKLSVGSKVLFDQQVAFEGADWTTTTSLPIALFAGQAAELPTFTKTSQKNSARLWESTRNVLLEERFLAYAFDAIPAGKHKVTVSIQPRYKGADKAAVASGAFTLVVDANGKAALAKRAKRKAPKAAGGKFAKVDKKLLAITKGHFGKGGNAVLMVRSQTRWHDTPHPTTGRVVERRIKAAVVYRTPEGECRLAPLVKYCQKTTRQGGGTPLTSLALCERFSASTLGSGVYAFPCRGAK